jgi:DNA-binding transcriptional ArsR family regulator
MLAKPRWLVDRAMEWQALARFVERQQRLAVVYGPRRVGKSYLLDALCQATGGYRHQAIAGTMAAQLDDFGQAVGERLGVGALHLRNWADALDRVRGLDLSLLVIDELPYLTEAAPELTSLLQRHVDAKGGPPLILAGSALSTMTELVSSRAPLYGRAAAVVIPTPFAGRDLVKLWDVDDPSLALAIDAAIGGLPGYRPLLEPPTDLDGWMTTEVLAASSPLLDAAEAALADVPPRANRGVHRAILAAIAQGERSFNTISRAAGLPAGALSRPLSELERAGLVSRVADPLRARRDGYDLADPHLRMWLTMIAPYRSVLQAGRAAEVWERLRATTWRAQVLGPRWEAVVRDHVARGGIQRLEPIDRVGATTVSDRRDRVSHEVDIVAVRGQEVVAIGEAKLRRLTSADADRLRRIRDLIGAPDARLVLASFDGVDATVGRQRDVIALTPREVYR